jgi:acyl-CoA synthetase (AMP-forming)/AMP-acid ligase II
MNLKFIKYNQTLSQALQEIAQRHPQREVMVFAEARGGGDQRITLAQLRARVEALAAGLRGLGIGRGDKVGLILPNCPEFVYAVFALAEIGAAAVPMNTQSRVREVEHILRDAETVAVVTDVRAAGNDLIAMITELRPALPNLRHVIVKGGEQRADAIAFDDLLRTDPRGVVPGPAAEPTDAAMILYTSGTTGVPKGAVHSHRTLITALRILVGKYLEIMTPSWGLIKVFPKYLKTVRRLPWLGEVMLTLIDRAQLKLLVLTPFYHMAGYFQIVMGALTGDKLVILDRFHPEKALELIQRERVTLVFGVPPMFQAMLARPNFAQYDLSSVILSVTGAMPVPPQLVRELRERIGGIAMILYGTTEIAATAVTLPMDPESKQLGTVGRADLFKDIKVKIVDEQRREVARGVVGEIAVRAPMLMEGYYKRPEATAEAVDSEGWYYTGDMGVIDAEGYVQVLGRRGDMIIRAGANIYPAEIENFLLTHPQIERVAVVGVPSPAAGGEKVLAYVVPKEGATLEAKDVLGYCWGQIAAYKIPDEVVFVADLPITSALQKVQHYKLRQQALQERQGRTE